MAKETLITGITGHFGQESVQREIGPTGMVVFEKARFLSLYGDTRASEIHDVAQCDTMLDY
jgi:hypothetical protein